MKFAVIETGGKQYKVKEGDIVKIDKIIPAKGEKVIFDKEKCSVCELCVVTCPTRAMGLFSEAAQKVA